MQGSYSMLLDIKQVVVMQYQMNPQMLTELPIVVIWNTEARNFNLKYMLNSKYRLISYLSFTLSTPGVDLKIHDQQLKKLKLSKDFMSVEKE